MDILVYGLGQRFKKNIEYFKKVNVIGVYDRKINSSDGLYMDFVIKSVQSFCDCDYDYVVVTPASELDEIVAMLVVKYGIDYNRIICLEQFWEFLNESHIEKKIDINDGLRKYNDIRKWSATNYYCDYSTKLDKTELSSISESDVYFRGYLYKYYRNDHVNMFVVSHKEYCKPAVSIYKTIRVGSEKKPSAGEYSDGEGDNIAKYNPLINEATALYWIWKNDNSPIVGLNHYRRYFQSLINTGLPIQRWEILEIMDSYDAIVAEHVWFERYSILQVLKKSVCKEAFDISYEVVKEAIRVLDPSVETYFEKMINGNMIFPCEMFVMRRELLNKCCEWLFPIVFHVIQRIEVSDEWDDYSKRIIGFWTERLFSLWLLKEDLRIFELPILLTDEGTPFGKN